MDPLKKIKGEVLFQMDQPKASELIVHSQLSFKPLLADVRLATVQPQPWVFGAA